MGKKGRSWLSSVKKIFKSSSKDSPVPENKASAQVVYSKYAGTEMEFNGSKHLIVKDDDMISILETDDEVKDLKLLSDRVLIKIAEVKKKTVSDLLLTEATKEKPSVGTSYKKIQQRGSQFTTNSTSSKLHSTMEEINNNTEMNESSTSRWLSDLEMDEYSLFPEECNLNFLDADEEKQEFVSHDIVNVFQEQNQQQCLNSESTLNNSFSDETSFESFDFNFEKPTLSPKLSSSSSNSSFQSLILSFDNQNSPATNTPQFYEFDPTTTLNSKQNQTGSVSLSSLPQLGNMNVSTQTPKGSSKNQNLETKCSQPKRSRANAEDHIMAERKRREILSQSFIALAALLPNLKKMDKASVLADSIKYVKELKERLEVLEGQNKKTEAEWMIVPNKPDLGNDDDNSSCDESIEGGGGGGDSESVLQVEARVLGKEILIRIQCKKHKGVLVKMMGEIQSYELFAVNSSVLPFGDSVLDITIIAQMGEGYSLSTKEVVKKLRMAALKFMSS